MVVFLCSKNSFKCWGRRISWPGVISKHEDRLRSCPSWLTATRNKLITSVCFAALTLTWLLLILSYLPQSINLSFSMQVLCAVRLSCTSSSLSLVESMSKFLPDIFYFSLFPCLYRQVIILIGNKADLEAQRDVTYEEAKQFAEENGEPRISPRH